MMAGLLCWLLDLTTWGILIWVVLSWIPTTEGHPLRSVKNLLDRVLHPLLRPIRNFIPPVRVGGAGVDLSPLVLMMAVLLLQRIIC